MKKIEINKMCTSIAIGFYIRGEEEYEEFKLKMIALSKADNCIFSIYEHKPEYLSQSIEDKVVQDDIEDDFVVI